MARTPRLPRPHLHAPGVGAAHGPALSLSRSRLPAAAGGGARAWAIAALGVGLLHCGGDDSMTADGMGAGGAGWDGGLGGSGAVAGTGGSGGTTPPPPPPEQEVEGSFRAPVATGRLVWSANPESGRVALIDATTLAVTTVEAGAAPTTVAAIAETEQGGTALVLNLGSHDATLLRAESASAISALTLETHPGADSIAVSPSGRWAVAWSDARNAERPDATEAFQDVSVLDLTPGAETSTRLTVGYRPVSLHFSADEAELLAVTEPGVSVVELTGAAPARRALVPLSADPLDDPAVRDVSLTADGRYAVVRRDTSAVVGLVPLDGGPSVDLALGALVTDLDLSADGTLAVAVMRESGEIAVIPVPAGFSDPTLVVRHPAPGEVVGSVSLSADARVGLLYTNAYANPRVSVLDLAPGAAVPVRTVDVKAPVLAAFLTGDAAHAVLLQSPAAGGTKAGAFSVVPTLTAAAPRIVGTDAPPLAVAVATGSPSDRAVVTVGSRAGSRYGVYLVRLPSLQVDYLSLASPPLATGMVPAARRAFVAQEHSEGRITFIDLDTGTARTLTGFELGAHIRD